MSDPEYIPYSTAVRVKNIQLLASGQYSDFTIKCQDRDFRVHRVILSAHSPFFDKIFSSGFRESHENIVILNDHDPAIIYLVIRWLYTGDYSTDTEIDEERKSLGLNPHVGPITSAKVYLAADQFMIQSLKRESYEAIRTDLLGGSLDEEARLKALRYSYEKTESQELQELFIFATLDAVHARKLDEKKLELLIKTMPDLAWDLFRMRNSFYVKICCRYCKATYELGNKETDCYCAFQGLCSSLCSGLSPQDLDCPGCENSWGFCWDEGQSFWASGELIVT